MTNPQTHSVAQPISTAAASTLQRLRTVAFSLLVDRALSA